MRVILLWTLLMRAVPAGAAAFEWSAYGGDGHDQRHAPIAQITPQNVGQPELVWSFYPGEPGQVSARGR